jgi:hypothetical protein
MGLLCYCVLSDERMDLKFALAASPLEHSPEGLKTIFYCLHFLDSPNLEGQVSIFISPRDTVARLYPRALGSLSVSSYDSQS